MAGLIKLSWVLEIRDEVGSVKLESGELCYQGVARMSEVVLVLVSEGVDMNGSLVRMVRRGGVVPPA